MLCYDLLCISCWRAQKPKIIRYFEGIQVILKSFFEEKISNTMDSSVLSNVLCNSVCWQDFFSHNDFVIITKNIHNSFFRWPPQRINIKYTVILFKYIWLLSQTGIYWSSLLDSYSTTFSILLFAISECIGLSWMYGIKRFTNDIRCMIGDGYVDFIGFKWWPLLWCSVTPAILFVSIRNVWIIDCSLFRQSPSVSIAFLYYRTFCHGGRYVLLHRFNIECVYCRTTTKGPKWHWLPCVCLNNTIYIMGGCTRG